MTTKPKNTKTGSPMANKPYVGNCLPLREWLDKNNAHCNWQKPLGDPEAPGAYVESWSTGESDGRAMFIIVINANQFVGWEIFTANPTNSVSMTLADADARIDAFRPKPEAKPPKADRPLMPWTDVKHFIAQGAINIAEGLTTIAAGSKVHRAMESFCKLVNDGGLEPRRPRHTNEDE